MENNQGKTPLEDLLCVNTDCAKAIFDNAVTSIDNIDNEEVGNLLFDFSILANDEEVHEMTLFEEIIQVDHAAKSLNKLDDDEKVCHFLCIQLNPVLFFNLQQGLG